jgi:hypothetical protein
MQAEIEIKRGSLLEKIWTKTKHRNAKLMDMFSSFFYGAYNKISIIWLDQISPPKRWNKCKIATIQEFEKQSSTAK